VFYHVRITPRGAESPHQDALALDKDADWIEGHITAPRRHGQDIFVDGRVFSWADIEQIHITETDQTVAQLVPQLRSRREEQGQVLSTPDEWFVVKGGRDVTEQFITGPPGQARRAAAGKALTYATNRKAVMVIYGHDKEANDALFDWLRAIGLQPREWNQLISAAGAASPYIGQVLEQALEQVQAVVAFFTPDEYVITGASAKEQSASRMQARPNVLIEAGMALITHPHRTVLAVLGNQELPSDLAGRHYIRLSHTNPAPLHDLATRLHHAGCDTDLSGADWLRPSRFPNRDHILQAHCTDAARTSPRVPATSPPSRLAGTLTGHKSEEVYGVAFSRDGILLATASGNGLRLWDVPSGNQVPTFKARPGSVLSVAFSPDGTLLATGGLDGTARLWDVTSNEFRAFRDFGGWMLSVAFSPDGTLLATVKGISAQLWDVATGERVCGFSGHTRDVQAVAFSPVGTLLATASSDKTVRLWDFDGRFAQAFTGHSRAVFGLAFSPDGTLLATASEDKTARLWDTATGRQVSTLTGHTGSVRAVAFSPDGTLLATASNDSTARIWR
jgi:WD40 repeat protein